ncbi:MAG: NfeD family protein [Tepidimonas sp.]|uniref:NfeD family protein n=1 Tax=Tepidimonas sp. TaxID=2002775 RepID=UPI00259E2583|nr:NfeD family protein [Tepidimonas sp.]MDM7456355.1 NfeD family protein [Tepidimonas sp.]
MDDATLWWVLTGLLLATELLSGTFFVLMLALAAAAGALAAHAGMVFSAQLLVAGLCALLTVGGWAWLRLQRRSASAQVNPDVVLDVGQTVQVQDWQPDGTAQVRYRGAQWLAVISTAHGDRRPGPHRICAVQGNRLVIEPLDPL